ncbi:MAG: RluA family pseudouridine synthase [Planctomycetales bacterium]|nr:RluA family pseudouridine synthase [Planctomycetales bacterium]
MHHAELEILYEDNHLLAVNKPAMLPTMGVAADVPSLLTVAKESLRVRYDKPGNVYVGVVSRLDAPVTGVTLLAKTSKAAARLSEAFRTRNVEKVYWAATTGDVDPPSGALEHYLRHDDRHRRVHATNASCPDAQFARLTYRTLATGDELSLLEVTLETGRKHQIRVQLSKAGWPIVGDRKYGSDALLKTGIALHSRRLSLEHPVRHEPLTIVAPLPQAWHKRRDLAELVRAAGDRPLG